MSGVFFLFMTLTSVQDANLSEEQREGRHEGGKSGKGKKKKKKKKSNWAIPR